MKAKIESTTFPYLNVNNSMIYWSHELCHTKTINLHEILLKTLEVRKREGKKAATFKKHKKEEIEESWSNVKFHQSKVMQFLFQTL